MLIDWFTVGAQALNFIILVWLLKRFLYKPILEAVDAREKRIAAQISDADKKKADSQKERDEFEQKNEAFAQQRAGILAKAVDEAKAERQRLIDEARSAADSLSAKRRDTMRNDARNMNQAIGRRVQQEVFAIARKALIDLAGASLEERVGEVFIRRVAAMDGDTKACLREALKTTPDPVLVRSAFDLSAKLQGAIESAVNEALSSDVHLRFETAPSLVSGIELSVNGQKIAWSIANYLTSLEKGVNELLKERGAPHSKPEAPPKATASPPEPRPPRTKPAGAPL